MSIMKPQNVQDYSVSSRSLVGMIKKEREN